MPYATTDDGVKLYYEETGAGTPIVFVHEFAADHRSWETQMRHFGQRYRCITYGARGYPPSDVPEKSESYSQDRATDDILAVMDHLEDRQGACRRPVHGRLRHPAFRLSPSQRARSLVVAGVGYGAEKDQQAKFKAEVEVVAKSLLQEGMAAFAEKYAYGPTRVQFENKDPRGFAQFKKELAEHSALGSANTQIGCQGQRPSLYDLRGRDARHDGADPGPDRRRGLAVPRAVAADEARDPVGGAGGDAQLRPHHQPRGSRPVQPDRRRLHRPGRSRPLAQARSARHEHLDHGDEEVGRLRP